MRAERAGKLDIILRAIILQFTDAGWSSLVARRAHNPKVAGSNPAPAMNERSSLGAAVRAFGPGSAGTAGVRTRPERPDQAGHGIVIAVRAGYIARLDGALVPSGCFGAG